MRLIPKMDWCFTDALTDNDRMKEDWIHLFSFAKDFTVWNFLTFDMLWRHTSDGEGRMVIISDLEFSRLLGRQRLQAVFEMSGNPESAPESAGNQESAGNLESDREAMKEFLGTTDAEAIVQEVIRLFSS